MHTFSFHDVDLEVYDRLDVLELHGPTRIWKELRVGEDKIVFHPGDWRYDGPTPREDSAAVERFYDYDVPVDGIASS